MLQFIESNDIKGLILYCTVRSAIIIVCWAIMITSCLIDLWSGRNTAKALGEKLESHKYRRTITKIGDYARVMLFALMFDLIGFLLPFYDLPFAIMLCTIAVLLIEGKSVVENASKKKAHAAEIPQIVKDIISAATTKDAEQIIEKLKLK